MPLAAGSKLGPYEVLSLLGAGGMGELYLAPRSAAGRHVAIKILPAAFSADPDRVWRFEREARAIASLNHPFICTIHDIGEHEGTWCWSGWKGSRSIAGWRGSRCRCRRCSISRSRSPTRSTRRTRPASSIAT